MNKYFLSLPAFLLYGIGIVALFYVNDKIAGIVFLGLFVGLVANAIYQMSVEED